MNIVIFGLSISSAWGNGHATLWRGLLRALKARGHEIHFFERDAPYYAQHRDSVSFPFADLHIYSEWAENRRTAEEQLARADVGIVTSYCPDGIAACELVLNVGLQRTVFYDMDTPVTLSRLEQGELVPYIPPTGLAGFDLVLSYTGGEALTQLRERLHAQRPATLYGWVDPGIYHPVGVSAKFAADLSYLGTYSPDRQVALEELLIDPARRLSEKGFVIGGAMYSDARSWPKNLRYYDHVSPEQHAEFYSSSPLTLNVTRGSMAAMGYCPSGRLFEAAACGTAVLSDWWTGLDTFFEPGEEIIIANSGAEAMTAIGRARADLERVGRRARQRALDCHTADIRAERLISLIENPRDEAAEAEAGLRARALASGRM